MTDLAERLGMSIPIVAAPMAGGPSTPELVAAVSAAGGLGFLPAGYQKASWLRDQIAAVRALTDRPFGVNLFVPGPDRADRAAIEAYATRLQPTADRLGVPLGVPHWDDDDYPAKLAVLDAAQVSAVSFTFGCPSPADVDRMYAAGTAVIVTVTTLAEARAALEAGADALCVQGAEAGAHRGVFVDDADLADAPPLLDLLAQLGAIDLPKIATGGLMTGAGIARVLRAGAVAAQLGTAFLCCPEAGTTDTHRKALLSGKYAETAFTRAFTGRTARGLVNAFLAEHTATAPSGYPWVHHLTRPLRSAAAAQGNPDALHLWAGTGHASIRPLPAADLIAVLMRELAAAT